MSTHPKLPDGAILLKSGTGRIYNCGKMTAVFKADEEETSAKYSVSEWWIEPQSEGPGAHKHDENDELFFAMQGTTSFLVGDTWIDAEQGSFLRIPAGTMHDFANRTDARTGILNVYIPGGFERNMPSIVQWFVDQKSTP